MVISKRYWLLFALVLQFLGLCFSSNAQIVIQPGVPDGKDATIDSSITVNPQLFYVPMGNSNNAAFGVAECAPDGFNVPCWFRFLVNFDLTPLAGDTTFNSAEMVLYAHSIQPNSFRDSSVFSVSRIIKPWYEDSVTWLNQPQYDSTQEVFFTINDSTRDSVMVNVAPLIKAILNNPSASYGLLVDMTIWNMYGYVGIYTSEFGDSARRPKLVVDYPNQNGIETFQDENNVRIIPNPVNNLLNVEYKSSIEAVIKVYDVYGKLMLITNMPANANRHSIATDFFPSGMYILQILSQTKQLTVKRFVVAR